MVRRRSWVLAPIVQLALTTPALASLDIGERAPNFTIDAVQGGQAFTYSLADYLVKGPVVLYFFPAAFSEGCSIEAHSFAEAVTEFEALGASLIGISGDDIELLSRFSVQACNGKFPVGSDRSLAVIKSFDAFMKTRPDFANRVSYVIAPNGTVVYSYISLNPAKHVQNTLGALREWRRKLAR